jgi:hypothetical protein
VAAVNTHDEEAIHHQPRWAILTLLFGFTLLTACAEPPAPASQVDVQATIDAGVRATLAAQPTEALSTHTHQEIAINHCQSSQRRQRRIRRWTGNDHTLVNGIHHRLIFGQAVCMRQILDHLTDALHPIVQQ